MLKTFTVKVYMLEYQLKVKLHVTDFVIMVTKCKTKYY